MPDPDAAIFLCALDHKTGYARPHRVGASRPLSGSELMWALGLRSAEREPGLFTARRLREATAHDVSRWFGIDEEAVRDPERRAELLRDLASGLLRDHDGSAAAILAASGGRLGGPGGLLSLLRPYEAYSDPLGKKSYLFAKISERRGWIEVADPESWEVSADNVLMRLALRSGLVEPGPLQAVRADTRDALRALAAEAGLSPPVLDDLLWELGRDDPDLLGREAGDIAEPSRDPTSVWY